MPVELIRAEILIERDGALIPRANAIPPMIPIGIAASGPSKQWWLKPFQRVEHIKPDAAHVWNRGVLADPYAAVNAASEEFDELPMKLRPNPADDIFCINLYYHDNSLFVFITPPCVSSSSSTDELIVWRAVAFEQLTRTMQDNTPKDSATAYTLVRTGGVVAERTTSPPGSPRRTLPKLTRWGAGHITVRCGRRAGRRRRTA